MIFAVTPLYVLPLAAIFLALWFRVSSPRSATGISFGDEGNLVLLRRVRQHGLAVNILGLYPPHHTPPEPCIPKDKFNEIHDLDL